MRNAALAAVLWPSAAATVAKGTMNPVRYTVSNALPGAEGREQPYQGEHFEVYSPPIKSQYSQVVWKQLDAVPLPPDIVSRFNNSVMAITGWEVDVVRRTAAGDVSVPCYESYNHHYSAWLKGRDAVLTQERGPDHGHGPSPVFRSLRAGASGVPQVQAMNEHNGNEARQSFHGLPKGYVQPVESPEAFVMFPMQINMRNPDGSGTRGGPLPRASAAPPGAAYSGLLECPCTTRIKKVLNGHMTLGQGTCSDSMHSDAVDLWNSSSVAPPRTLPVASAAECFEAATSALGGVHSNRSISDTASPAGCFVAPQKGGGMYDAFFNDLGSSTAPCGVSQGPAFAAGRARSLVDVELEVGEAAQQVRITLAGPDGKWFGVGFGASAMADQPYTLIVDGWGNVTERRLDNHAPGRELPTTVRVNSSTAAGGRRTVVLTRATVGASQDYYTFEARQTTVPFINALGGGPSFAQHVQKATSAISMVLSAGTTCICRKPGGSIAGINFDPQCPAWPLSDLAKNHNPSCDASTYVGGMACCRDGMFLLDEDQEIPPYVDEVYYKWRIYFTDFDAKTLTPIIHLEWALNGCDSGGGSMPCHIIEYDVPKAPAGTPPEEAVHTVTSHFQVRNMFNPCDEVTDSYCADPRKATAGVELVMAGGHCHAPACLSIELLNADTGESLCKIEPQRGTGDKVMDEEGYLWLPPCLWGSAEQGLRPRPLLQLDTNLTSVKRANSTYYHYGVMAIWQMRGAYHKAPGYFV